MHYCVNIVTGRVGSGEAVLLRAIIPDRNVPLIRQRRNNRPGNELAIGPAKICQALAIDLTDNGKQLNASEFILLPPNRPLIQNPPSKRVGISKDTDRLWRFTIYSP
jgi:DNA-3-methyladenine glycosylase